MTTKKQATTTPAVPKSVHDFSVEQGRIGGQMTKELIEKGKAYEREHTNGTHNAPKSSKKAS